MPSRRDYLKECHSQIVKQVKENLPLEDFGSAYCVRCLQPECSRSTHGVTKFDQRVATWQKRLFLKVPRMDKSDPRFGEIASKEFHPVQEALIVQGWGVPEESISKREILSEPPQEITVDELPDSEPIAQNPYFQSSNASTSRETLLLNTSVEKEQYLPGAQPPTKSDTTKKRIDSWGAPEQSTPSEVVVTAGATVRFGSGSGVSK
jgi:hypothetical protein